MPSAHVDTFARDSLPPIETQPEYLFELPSLQFPPQLNCATALLDDAVDVHGWGERSCLRAYGVHWTYRELLDRADRVAHVLTHEMGVVPGNRVLLRAPNSPMLVACWFAVMKVGAIAVTTMPMLRAGELATIVRISQATHALCDAALAADLREAAVLEPVLRSVRCFNEAGPDGLEQAMARYEGRYPNVNTASDDTCLLGFTSGTTGVP